MILFPYTKSLPMECMVKVKMKKEEETIQRVYTRQTFGAGFKCENGFGITCMAAQ